MSMFCYWISEYWIHRKDKYKFLCKFLYFSYPKLLQSNKKKFLMSYQCDYLFLCPMMSLRQHLAKEYKVFKFSISLLLIFIGCKTSVPWLGTLVFLRLIVRSKPEHSDEIWLSSFLCKKSNNCSILSKKKIMYCDSLQILLCT